MFDLRRDSHTEGILGIRMSQGLQRKRRRFATHMVLVVAGVFAVVCQPALAGEARGKKPTPVIFVHGSSGSAQQFETNAMRLTSNGFPQKRIFAYEYDTLVSNNDAAIANLDGFIADVQEQTGSDRVDVLAHSRGTTVMHSFLGDPYRAATVRRYVNFDGRTSAAEPGGVRTLAVWGEGDQSRAIGGAENVYFPDKAHTEVTTSAEAFKHVYEFLLGKKPRHEVGGAGEAEQGHGQGPRPRLPHQHRDG